MARFVHRSPEGGFAVKFTDIVAEIKAVKDRIREEFGVPDRMLIT